MARFGLDPASIPEDTRLSQNPLIWPDMRESVSLFFALDTQWNWVGAGMAGAFRSGIDYGSIAPVAAALGVSVTARHFADIRAMESEAISVWSKRR